MIIAFAGVCVYNDYIAKKRNLETIEILKKTRSILLGCQKLFLLQYILEFNFVNFSKNLRMYMKYKNIFKMVPIHRKFFIFLLTHSCNVFCC